MGRRREEQRTQTAQTAQTAQPSVNETAEQIALLLLSGSQPGLPGATVTQLAPLLLTAVPGELLRLPPLASAVAQEGARLALSFPLEVPAELPDASRGIVRAAALDAALYRAHYATNAARRLGRAVLEVADERDRLDALRVVLVQEKRYLDAHREANRRRVAAARVIEGLVELHGPVLSWRHGETRLPEEPRPTHKAADGKNFDARLGPPALTGAWPGVLSFCSCMAGPPIAGAMMLAGSGSGGSGGGGSRGGGSGRGSGGDRRRKRLEELRRLSSDELGARIERIRADKDLPAKDYHFETHGEEIGAGTLRGYLDAFERHLSRRDLRFFSFIRNVDRARMWIAVSPTTGRVSQYNETREEAFSFYSPADIGKYLRGRERSAVEIVQAAGVWKVKE